MEGMEKPAEELLSGSLEPADDDDPLIGTLLLDKYKIVSFQAQNDLTRVYRLEGDLTAKILHEHLAENPRTAKRFKQEAEKLLALDHPSISLTFEVNRLESGEPFIIEERLPGSSLAQILEDTGPLAYESAITVFQKVCGALDFAHSKGVLHRCLNTTKVMVEECGQDPKVIVTDFGTGKALPNPGRETKSALDLSHIDLDGLSPEHLLGDKLDERSDIYSFGWLMFETITNSKPYPGQNQMQIGMLLATNAKPQRLRLPELQYPSDLEWIINKCMEIEPSERYQSVSDLHQDLERVRQGMPVARTCLPVAATTPVTAAAPLLQSEKKTALMRLNSESMQRLSLALSIFCAVVSVWLMIEAVKLGMSLLGGAFFYNPGH